MWIIDVMWITFFNPDVLDRLVSQSQNATLLQRHFCDDEVTRSLFADSFLTKWVLKGHAAVAEIDETSVGSWCWWPSRTSNHLYARADFGGKRFALNNFLIRACRLQVKCEWVKCEEQCEDFVRVTGNHICWLNHSTTSSNLCQDIKYRHKSTIEGLV